MLHYENHNHNPKIKQTRQFFPSPEQFDFWGYVSIPYHPRNVHGYSRFFLHIYACLNVGRIKKVTKMILLERFMIRCDNS